MNTEHIPLISVIMTTYNHEKYIAEAIQSILVQTFSDFELVIVNDGSIDRTGEIITSFQDKRIVYIYQENMGPSASANTAIKNAKGKYIALMSGDDVCYPERLERQIEEYDRKGAKLLFSLCDFIDDDSRLLTENNYLTEAFNKTHNSRVETLKVFFYSGNYLCAPSAFFERKMINEIGLFDIRLLQLQDFDFWVKALLKGYDIHHIPEKLIKYRIRNNKENLGSPRKDSIIRSRFELKKILRKYLTITDKDEFLSIFPEVKKISEQFDVKDIPYMILLLAHSGNNSTLKEFADETIFEEYDSEYYNYLKDKFGFKMKDFYSYSGYYEIGFSQLFIDTGNGFNENEKIVVESDINSNFFNLTFDLSEWKNIRSVRFDPFEGFWGKVRLESVTYKDDHGTTKSIGSNAISSNGTEDKDNYFIFKTSDPMVFIQTDTGFKYLTIKGDWELLRETFA